MTLDTPAGAALYLPGKSICFERSPYARYYILCVGRYYLALSSWSHAMHCSFRQPLLLSLAATFLPPTAIHTSQVTRQGKIRNTYIHLFSPVKHLPNFNFDSQSLTLSSTEFLPFTSTILHPTHRQPDNFNIFSTTPLKPNRGKSISSFSATGWRLATSHHRSKHQAFSPAISSSHTKMCIQYYRRYTCGDSKKEDYRQCESRRGTNVRCDPVETKYYEKAAHYFVDHMITNSTNGMEKGKKKEKS